MQPDPFKLSSQKFVLRLQLEESGIVHERLRQTWVMGNRALTKRERVLWLGTTRAEDGSKGSQRFIVRKETLPDTPEALPDGAPT